MLALPEDLADLLKVVADGTVANRESKTLEFKQDFDSSNFSYYTKTLAAFANAEGGVIVFGVANKPRRVVGTVEAIDEAQWADRLREDFEPEIVFAIKEYSIGTKNLFAIGVNSAPNKPAICKKSRSKAVMKKGKLVDVEVVREGAVYYRYAGQSKVIGFSELHTMLVAREQHLLRQMMETLQVIQKVGIDRAGVLDMSAKTTNIVMTEETAKGLSFIDKGNIVKEKGAPAYVVMGAVDVGTVVHAPMEEADKNLPTEAAEILTPVVRSTYGQKTKIYASQVTAILKHLGLHDDNRHCVVEKKLRRKYITRAGIDAVSQFIKSDPLTATKTFGGKTAIAEYEATLPKT